MKTSTRSPASSGATYSLNARGDSSAAFTIGQPAVNPRSTPGRHAYTISCWKRAGSRSAAAISGGACGMERMLPQKHRILLPCQCRDLLERGNHVMDEAQVAPSEKFN